MGQDLSEREVWVVSIVLPKWIAGTDAEVTASGAGEYCEKCVLWG